MPSPGWDAVVVFQNGKRLGYLSTGPHTEPVLAARALVQLVGRATQAGRVIVRGTVAERGTVRPPAP